MSPVNTAMTGGYLINLPCSGGECYEMVESDNEEDEDGKNGESEEISGDIVCNQDTMEDILHGYNADDE
jgi:hypothetical protein